MIPSTSSPTSSTTSHLRETKDVTLNDVVLLVTGLNDKVQLLRNEILALKDSNVPGPLGLNVTRERKRPSFLVNAKAQSQSNYRDMRMQSLREKHYPWYEEKQKEISKKGDIDDEVADFMSEEAFAIERKKRKSSWIKPRARKKLTKDRGVQNSMGLTKSTSCTCLINNVHKEEIKCPKVRKKKISRGVQYVKSNNKCTRKRIARQLLNCFKRRWCVRKKSWKNVEKMDTPLKKSSVQVIYEPNDKVINQQTDRQKSRQRQSSRNNLSDKGDTDRAYEEEKKKGKREVKDKGEKASGKNGTRRNNVDEIRERKVEAMQSPRKAEAKSITLNSNEAISKRPANNGYLKSVDGKYGQKKKHSASSEKENTNDVLAVNKKGAQHELKMDNTNYKNRKAHSSTRTTHKNKQFKDNLRAGLNVNSKRLSDNSNNNAKNEQDDVAKDSRETSKNLPTGRLSGGGEPRRNVSSKSFYDQRSRAINREVNSVERRKKEKALRQRPMLTVQNTNPLNPTQDRCLLKKYMPRKSRQKLQETFLQNHNKQQICTQRIDLTDIKKQLDTCLTELNNIAYNISVVSQNANIIKSPARADKCFFT